MNHERIKSLIPDLEEPIIQCERCWSAVDKLIDLVDRPVNDELTKVIYQVTEAAHLEIRRLDKIFHELHAAMQEAQS